MFTRKRTLILVFSTLLALACGNSQTGSSGQQQESPTANEPVQEVAQEEPTEAPAESPTNTPEPPTVTPEPTATQGPPPTPVALSGSGDSVVDVPPGGQMIARISGNESAGFFAVTALDSNNDPVDLLVNTTEAYEGIRPLNLDKETARFEIKSSGPWSIELLPLESAEALSIPGEYSGSGDRVLRLEGEPSTATITGNEGGGFFAVIGRGGLFPDLLANTTDPYSGQSIVDNETTVLVIQASGPWSIKIE